MGWWGSPSASRVARGLVRAGALALVAIACDAPVRGTDAARLPRADSRRVEVAAPTLRNRGSDLVAVYRSLDRYSDWVAGHRPDPALLERVLVPGTAIAREWTTAVADLARRGHRRVKVGSAITGVRVVSRRGRLASLLVEYRDERIDIVDRNGTVVAEQSQAPHSAWIVVLYRGASGAWRIASVARRGGAS
jgi:hypothetical protein